jgi:hypothetical protein
LTYRAGILAIGLAATAFIAMTGCSRAVTNERAGAGPSPANPAVAISEPFTLQPSVSRLVSVTNYLGIEITLEPVNAQLTPPISATDAYARCQMCPHDQPVQGFRQQLAYFSSRTPATMSAACVPQGAPLPSSCLNPATVPIYSHRLAWVFTWYSECLALGPVGSSRPSARTCLNVVPFDATNGDESYSFSGGA